VTQNKKLPINSQIPILYKPNNPVFAIINTNYSNPHRKANLWLIVSSVMTIIAIIENC